MESSPTQRQSIQQQLDGLGADLLANKLSAEDFLDQVLALDQADPERKSALISAELLSRPDIIAVFQDPEDRAEFYRVRSLTYFHKAQIRCSKGEVNAKDDFGRALKDAETVEPVDAEWVNYIAATIAYLDNDLPRLKQLAETETLNKSLVQNFVQGLEERGGPDYLVDYAKKRDEQEPISKIA
jgi:hypothetical protein